MVPAMDQASKLGGEAQRRNSEAVPKATTTFLAPWHRASERETISTNNPLLASFNVGATLRAHSCARASLGRCARGEEVW